MPLNKETQLLVGLNFYDKMLTQKSIIVKILINWPINNAIILKKFSIVNIFQMKHLTTVTSPKKWFIKKNKKKQIKRDERLAHYHI